MGEKKTILNVHWGLIPGGVAKYAASLEKIILYGPFETASVLIHNENWFLDKEVLTILKPEVIMIKDRLDVTWAIKLRKYIKRIQPDLIFIYGFNGAFAASVACAGLKIPIVGSWHGDYYASSPEQRLRTPFIEILERLMYRYMVDHIIAVSQFAEKRLSRKGIKKKISVIHNGISRRSILSAKTSNSKKLIVGTCCRLSEQKGLKWLLEAIAIVKQNNPDIKFIIWGDGPQKELLQKKAFSLGIEDVLVFAGHVDNIEECLSTLDIYMMSSFSEYFSIALLEAMRAGLPIVATRVGGNPEAIRNNVDGLLVPVEDPETFASAILRLAEYEDLRKKLGKSAEDRFGQCFTDEIMLQKTAGWFNKILFQASH